MNKILSVTGVTLTALSLSLFAGPVANAYPGDPGCERTPGVGTLPCRAPDGVRCGLVAWKTWMPCNWFGVDVPPGTPGSM